MRSFRQPVLLALFSMLAASQLAGCMSQPTREDAPAMQTVIENRLHVSKLENGLKIIVNEDHRSPVVVSQVWYKVGSSYEHGGLTGVSHVLEHMMFKGTQKHPPGEFSEIIAANGGRENAFTGRDYTAYFQRIANDRLELCFELEADRMRNLTLDDKEFRKEVEVVKEERRMRTDDNPIALTYEQFMSSAFVNSTYHNPVIGWMDDLDNLTIEDLRAWYHTWYAPNNATLVVSGDVDPKQVVQLAEKYFGPLKPSKIAPPKLRREVDQKGERRISVEAPAKVPYLMMGFKVPVLATAENKDDVYALEVLANVLDGGDSSRLTSELIRGGIAAEASAGYDMYARQQSLFSFNATPVTGKTMQDVEQALMAQIKRLQQQPPSEAELERVKAEVMASAVFEQDSSFYQAMQLGMLETVGLSWRDKQAFLDKIRAVTPQQVQAVAAKYLVKEKMTVASLDPLPLTDNTPHSGMEMTGHVQ